jgi:hypothetical protein
MVAIDAGYIAHYIAGGIGFEIIGTYHLAFLDLFESDTPLLVKCAFACSIYDALLQM